jgi:nicotinamidase-related amidase
MERILLVVDVQNCFLNDFTRMIPERITALAASGNFCRVLFTRFENAEDSPYRRILDWHGCEDSPGIDLAPEIMPLVEPDCVYLKPGFTGIPGALAERLLAERPGEVAIAGIDTDMCVLKVAMDVFDLGFAPVVYVDCCASTAGLQAHLAGLAVLARNIGADNLRLAGTGQGYLGRPPDRPGPVTGEGPAASTHRREAAAAAAIRDSNASGGGHRDLGDDPGG